MLTVSDNFREHISTVRKMYLKSIYVWFDGITFSLNAAVFVKNNNDHVYVLDRKKTWLMQLQYVK
jgi:hypothetical protein